MKKLLLLAVPVLLCACVGTDILNDSEPGVAARVAISPASAAVRIGGSFQFMAAFYDSLGMEVAGATLQWHSADTTLATIGADGLAFGKRAGQVALTAISGGITSPPAMLTIVVDSQAVARVTVEPAVAEIPAGGSQQFAATAFNLTDVEITGVGFTWRSSNESIAAIDASGLASGVAPGQVDIVATANGTSSMPARLTVAAASRTGAFSKRPGTSYNVQGSATLERAGSGQLILRFGSDFSSSDGPGLHVFLSNSNAVTAGAVDLGDLKSTVGAQTYELPPGIQMNSFDWVVIHCLPFNVTFGYAELQ